MKHRKAVQNTARQWQKTQYSNLIRYVPSGTYFARLRVKGKLILKTLKTDVPSVAKLRLADSEKLERQSAETRTNVSVNSNSSSNMAVRAA